MLNLVLKIVAMRKVFFTGFSYSFNSTIFTDNDPDIIGYPSDREEFIAIHNFGVKIQ